MRLIGILIFIICFSVARGQSFTQQDKNTIEKIAKDLPLILTNEGWDAYQSYFAQDYQNWSMIGDQVRSRNEFLGLVKEWYDGGNRATASEIETIDFIPVGQDMVLYLHAQKEVFNDPQNPDVSRERNIRFTSLYRKEDDGWKVVFTAFMDKP
jgi:ketosteroid isomerase-like protein